jgi:hypothetical protein
MNLKDVAGQVFCVLDSEGDFPTFGRDFTPSFNIVTFVPTEIACSRHQDDLLEVGDVNGHHMRSAGSRATRTWPNEGMHILVSVHLSVQVRRLFVAMGIGIRETQGGILGGRPNVICLFPFFGRVLGIPINPTVS